MFATITLKEGITVLAQRKPENAAIFFCDNDLTLTEKHDHTDIRNSIGRLTFPRVMAWVKERQTAGQTVYMDEYEKKSDEIEQKEYRHNADFIKPIIEKSGLNGPQEQVADAIKCVHDDGNVVMITSYTDYPIASLLTVKNKVGIDADFVICDLTNVINRIGDCQPQFQVHQDPKNPKPHLFVILSGSGKADRVSPDIKNKASPNCHYEWATKLAKQIFGITKPHYKCAIDDEPVQTQGARDAGMDAIDALRDGKGEHWPQLKAKSAAHKPTLAVTSSSVGELETKDGAQITAKQASQLDKEQKQQKDRDTRPEGAVPLPPQQMPKETQTEPPVEHFTSSLGSYQWDGGFASVSPIKDSVEKIEIGTVAFEIHPGDISINVELFINNDSIEVFRFRKKEDFEPFKKALASKSLVTVADCLQTIVSEGGRAELDIMERLIRKEAKKSAPDCRQ